MGFGQLKADLGLSAVCEALSLVPRPIWQKATSEVAVFLQAEHTDLPPHPLGQEDCPLRSASVWHSRGRIAPLLALSPPAAPGTKSCSAARQSAFAGVPHRRTVQTTGLQKSNWYVTKQSWPPPASQQGATGSSRDEHGAQVSWDGTTESGTCCHVTTTSLMYETAKTLTQTGAHSTCFHRTFNGAANPPFLSHHRPRSWQSAGQSSRNRLWRGGATGGLCSGAGPSHCSTSATSNLARQVERSKTSTL